MFSVLIFAVLCTSCMAQGVKVIKAERDCYSFSTVGTGEGDSFALEETGNITGIRIWEFPSEHIAGLQVRYDGTWTSVAGSQTDHLQELLLHSREYIVQVSGKYNDSFISHVYFVTNRGRFVVAGQPTVFSFNMYPKYEEAALKLLSGYSNSGGIASLGTHWGFPTLIVD
ncbi:unnamed protein product [Ophioblennius macclurei]